METEVCSEGRTLVVVNLCFNILIWFVKSNNVLIIKLMHSVLKFIKTRND